TAQQPEATTPPATAPEAPSAQPPAEQGQPNSSAEVQLGAQAAPEQPEGEAKAETNAQSTESGLPVAESLTGDARVYRIWLYTSGQEGDARSYWDKLRVQYPRLLTTLELDLRRYFLGEAKGSVYRVFAGPFEDLGAAQKACEDIKLRSGEQFCRPVLN